MYLFLSITISFSYHTIQPFKIVLTSSSVVGRLDGFSSVLKFLFGGGIDDSILTLATFPGEAWSITHVVWAPSTPQPGFHESIACGKRKNNQFSSCLFLISLSKQNKKITNINYVASGVCFSSDFLKLYIMNTIIYVKSSNIYTKPILHKNICITIMRNTNTLIVIFI